MELLQDIIVSTFANIMDLGLQYIQDILKTVATFLL